MTQRGGNTTTYTGAVDNAVYPVTVTVASQSFEDLIGTALNADAEQVEIVNQGGATVFYQADATAAVVADLPIPTNSTYVCVGGKDELDRAQLIAAGNVAIHLIERITR